MSCSLNHWRRIRSAAISKAFTNRMCRLVTAVTGRSEVSLRSSDYEMAVDLCATWISRLLKCNCLSRPTQRDWLSVDRRHWLNPAIINVRRTPPRACTILSSIVIVLIACRRRSSKHCVHWNVVMTTHQRGRQVQFTIISAAAAGKWLTTAGA